MKTTLFQLLILMFNATSSIILEEHKPKCCLTCDNTTKYYSIAEFCGESCIKESEYYLYKLFEHGLTKAETNTPCLDNGYAIYNNTVTHGFGPIKCDIDLYSH